MVDQVRERHAAKGNPQILHVCEIRLSSLPWPMSLLKDDILLRPMQRFPLRDMTLQRAYLDRLVALGMPLAQQRKQRGPEASPGLVPAAPRPTANLLQTDSDAFATCGDVSVRWATFPPVHIGEPFARSFPLSQRRLVGWLLCVSLA